MLQERSAGCVLFNESDVLLLNYSAGHWDFPKGNIEKLEKDVDTVVREVEEETGIADIEFIEGFKETVRYFYRRNGQSVKKEVVFFLAKTKTKKVRLSDEHIAFVWLPFDDALKKTTYENSKQVLRKAIVFLKKRK